MIHNLTKAIGCCFIFVICCIFGYVIYPFYNLLSVYILFVLGFCLCSLLSINKFTLQKYALWFLIFFIVSHIMVYGTVLAFSIGMIIRDDILYTRPSHDLVYPFILVSVTCLVLCITSAYHYIKESNEKLKRRTEIDVSDLRDGYPRIRIVENPYTGTKKNCGEEYEILITC